jgi:hypothetical protein
VSATKLSVAEVAQYLGYSESENWTTGDPAGRDRAQTLRAREAGVIGTYLFRTSPEEYPLLPKRPIVHIAEAETVERAREIHQKVWNLGNAPFLIIVLPDHVRVYTGFRYSMAEDEPLLQTPFHKFPVIVEGGLLDFHARQIDSGRIWETHGCQLPITSRVDQKLLKDLSELGRILINERELEPVVAHSLIGKYIYIRYLIDREIVSDRWLEEYGINKNDVLGPNANLQGLRQLVDALESRFNGRIFPLPLVGDQAPTDADVAFVASIFRGDTIKGQLALDFRIYDFFFIPIELLSSIYEQFLHARGDGKKVGAYYTSEPLAEYLLAEVNAVLPLESGYKILDPCCGSGVFLVLSYRRLVELELLRQRKPKLRPIELREILTGCIFGIERNLEACYVTEFSLILTMLSYIDPPELHRNKPFQFPNLHNENILHSDFFAGAVDKLIRNGLSFDWVVGNPPWVELDPSDPDEAHTLGWVRANSVSRPVARFRACEAFTWRATDLLSDRGYVGFVVHAKSLTNEQSTPYRQAFFLTHDVVKITNFSNLAPFLFEGRAGAPAATVVYRPAESRSLEERAPITHYAPFALNQLPVRNLGSRHSWTITVYENEISTVEAVDAASGSPLTWKIALWGSYRDKALLRKFERLFPHTLEALALLKGWAFGLGVQLRHGEDQRSGEVEPAPDLVGKWVLDFDQMNAARRRFCVPESALIVNDHGYLRKRGGKKGLSLMQAPHMVITPSYAAYSDTEFIVKHPRVAIAAPPGDADHLRALSLYLNSNIARYLAFFSSTRWGVDRITGGYIDIAGIRVPDLDEQQIAELAKLHGKWAISEGSQQGEPDLFHSGEHTERLGSLTRELALILRLPSWISDVVDEFITIRLETIDGKTGGLPAQSPRDHDLRVYAEALRQQLESFARIPHYVSVRVLRDFITCEIETARREGGIEIVTARAAADVEERLWAALRVGQTQWMYVQRSLRVFDGTRMYLYKPKRLIDWTRTQALLDSDDIIAEVLGNVGRRS